MRLRLRLGFNEYLGVFREMCKGGGGYRWREVVIWCDIGLESI